MLPAYGIVGVVGALVISSYADAFVLGWAAIRLYGVPLRSFIPWKSVGKVALSAAISAAVIWSSVWVEWFGTAGVIVASIAYYAAFVSMLRILGVSELNTLALKVRNSLSMAFSYGRW